MSRITAPFLHVANLGVGSGAADELVRRIRILNLSAFIAFALNTSWTLVYPVIDLVAFQPVIVPNLVASAGYLATLLISARGSHVAATWTLCLSAFFNLSVAGVFFGLSGGIWLYLILVPVLAALFIDADDRVGLAVIVGGGTVLFGIVGLLAGEGPAIIAGTMFESTIFFFAAVASALTASALGFYYRRLAERAEERSERLLLNILPARIARRLKAGDYPIAEHMDEVSVLFGDIVDSTRLADRLAADHLVELLDALFASFDEIVEQCGLEKIKTSGDAYVAVAGIDPGSSGHAEAAATAALRMREALARHPVDATTPLEMRFGLHVGPVVAGVIGKRKFSYDLWGDTMNTASRMESTGVPGGIQVTAEFRKHVGNAFLFEPRGVIDIKGKGEIETYLLIGYHGDPASNARHHQP